MDLYHYQTRADSVKIYETFKEEMMRKTIYLITVFVVTCVLLLGGCGAKKEVTTGAKASEIVNKATLNMQKIKTFKAKAFYSITSATQGAQNMNYSFDIESDKTDPANITTKMSVKGTGNQNFDMYITGGYAYMAVPGKGWYKSPVKQEQIEKQASPENIARYTKGAEDMKIIKEDGISYTISFTISRKFLEEQMKSQMGEETQDSKEFKQYMEQIFKGLKMSCIFTISKKNLLVEKANIQMVMKDMPVIGDVNMTMNIEFSDFNKPLSIKLPDEAKTAQETKELEGQIGIPGIPGFGF